MSEILAPCGKPESLYAALNSGADAVYVGLKNFSARKNCGNFSQEELNFAVRECHKRGVKIYAALNTLIYDREVPEFALCVTEAAKSGIDAVIVQDIGAAEIIRKICPALPIHASTQMTLCSVSGVKFAEERGFTRVVLSRELSFEQIKEIADNTNIELEVFVHGALCVSLSGQCYMSALFGGRSGNRGLCAQPCRLDFSYGKRHNVMSLKDCSLVSHLKELEKAGVYSFKIEGRMKRPEYVACVCDACRKALNGESYDEKKLRDIFSREGFTEGYYSGKINDMSGIRTEKDSDSSMEALSGIKELYKSEKPRFKLDITLRAAENERIRAVGSSGDFSFEIIGEKPQKAQKKSVTAEEMRSRMGKLGGTMFFAGKIEADITEGIYIPASELNLLRRGICAGLEERIFNAYSKSYKIFDCPKAQNNKRVKKTFSLRAEAYNNDQLLQAVKLPFEKIYVPYKLLENFEFEDKDRIIAVPPVYLGNCENEVRKKLKQLKKLGYKRGLAHTLGHAYLLKQEGFIIHGGFRMNVLNGFSAEFCENYGFEDLILSIEGKASNLAEISSNIPKGIIAYGKLPLMAAVRCPITNGKTCGNNTPCNNSIEDRKRNKLPVLCGSGSVEILNPDVLTLSDRHDVLSNFEFAVLKFTVEKDVRSVFDSFIHQVIPQGKFTRGLYFRGVD